MTKKQEEVNSTRNLVLCLTCYEAKLEEGKEQKKNSLPLPDFSALCATEEQRQVDSKKCEKNALKLF